jgi:hypothetical protein
VASVAALLAGGSLRDRADDHRAPISVLYESPLIYSFQMAETAETDGTLLNFVEVVAPHETFGRFCNRNRLSFDESVKIAPGEKLAMLCWSSQLAETKGIRSTYGYLITVRARILKTVAIGGGRMRCYSEMIPASACNFPQRKLQQIADILCGYYPPPILCHKLLKT